MRHCCYRSANLYSGMANKLSKERLSRVVYSVSSNEFCDGLDNADLSSDLNSLFNDSKLVNVPQIKSAATQVDTGRFLYKLNGLFDDIDSYNENQQYLAIRDTNNPSEVADCSLEKSNFLLQIDVDALLECDTPEVRPPRTPICNCTDLSKPTTAKDLPGNRGLFNDLSISDDSDDDLGFGLFDDDDASSPVTVKPQPVDKECRTEQTTNSDHTKPTSTDSSDESDDDLGFGLFSDDEDSTVTKKVEPACNSVNSNCLKKEPVANTDSATTKTDSIKETVNICKTNPDNTSSKETDSEILESWFEAIMESTQSKQFVKRSDSEIDWCVICMDNFSNPRILHKCSHQFCGDCITAYFKVRPQCPVCFVVYGVIEGNQPRDGTMSHSVNNRLKLPGYDNHKTIVVYYEFPDGVQTEEHPNPGQQYWGTSRTAYLPDNDEGRKVLKLLKEAFKRRLVFTVGRSRTTGADNQVTWNDIHHKTCTHGGQQGFGYPDPTYLTRVQEELAAFGVTEESIRENK